MPKFRNIRVKMKGGKSRIQRAQVLASGKLKFVKNTGRKATRSAKKQARRSSRMAKKHHSGAGKRQGFVSWITSILAIIIGLGPALEAVGLWLFGGLSGNDLRGRLNSYYNPLAGDRAALAVGYGSIVGGLVFKIATSELAKRAKVKSLIPAMHA